MTDWCLCKPEESVYFGSSDDIRSWKNIPVMVIMNVPDEITLTEKELIEYFKRQKGEIDALISSHIAKGDMLAQPPKYVLVKLREKMTEEMKLHFTRADPFHNVFDWKKDNKSRKKDILNDPKWEYSKAFYINRLLKNKRDVIASDQRERSNLVFASERPDCFVASLLAMTKSDFFSSLLSIIS